MEPQQLGFIRKRNCYRRKYRVTRYPFRRGTAGPVMLEYVDGQGDRSARTVQPLALVYDEARRSSASTYLQARCSVARAVRTFRCDRIISMSDPETGEVIETSAWIADRQLGEAQPFEWQDEYAPAEIAAEPSIDAAPAARRTSLRLVAIALIVGYAIGRLRIITMALRYFHIRHGVWL